MRLELKENHKQSKRDSLGNYEWILQSLFILPRKRHAKGSTSTAACIPFVGIVEFHCADVRYLAQADAKLSNQMDGATLCRKTGSLWLGFISYHGSRAISLREDDKMANCGYEDCGHLCLLSVCSRLEPGSHSRVCTFDRIATGYSADTLRMLLDFVKPVEQCGLRLNNQIALRIRHTTVDSCLRAYQTWRVKDTLTVCTTQLCTNREQD